MQAPRRWAVLRWIAAAVVGLSVCLMPEVASAATAGPVGKTVCEGSQVFAVGTWGMSVTGPAGTGATRCTTATTLGVYGSGFSTTAMHYVCVGATDPRSVAGFPAVGSETWRSQGCGGNTMAAPDANGWQYVLDADLASGNHRYLAIYDDCASGCHVQVLWDLAQAPAPPPTTPPPTTSAAPSTTSAPPASTTPAPTSAPSTDSSTTSPASTTSAPPTGTTTPTDPGTGGTGGSTATPTPAPTVVTLSDDQWGEVLLALGATTFASMAGLVINFRRGR